MRPKSIIHAERLFLVSVALILVGATLDWTALVERGGFALAAGTVSFFVGAFLLLILFATRRGSRVARGLLATVTVLSTASMLWQIGAMQVALGWAGVINTAQMLLMVVATVLLFRPNASGWFAKPHAEWEEDL